MIRVQSSIDTGWRPLSAFYAEGLKVGDTFATCDTDYTKDGKLLLICEHVGVFVLNLKDGKVANRNSTIGAWREVSVRKVDVNLQVSFL